MEIPSGITLCILAPVGKSIASHFGVRWLFFISDNLVVFNAIVFRVYIGAEFAAIGIICHRVFVGGPLGIKCDIFSHLRGRSAVTKFPFFRARACFICEPSAKSVARLRGLWRLLNYPIIFNLYTRYSTAALSIKGHRIPVDFPPRIKGHLAFHNVICKIPFIRTFLIRVPLFIKSISGFGNTICAGCSKVTVKICFDRSICCRPNFTAIIIKLYVIFDGRPLGVQGNISRHLRVKAPFASITIVRIPPRKCIPCSCGIRWLRHRRIVACWLGSNITSAHRVKGHGVLICCPFRIYGNLFYICYLSRGFIRAKNPWFAKTGILKPPAESMAGLCDFWLRRNRRIIFYSSWDFSLNNAAINIKGYLTVNRVPLGIKCNIFRHNIFCKVPLLVKLRILIPAIETIAGLRRLSWFTALFTVVYILGTDGTCAAVSLKRHLISVYFPLGINRSISFYRCREIECGLIFRVLVPVDKCIARLFRIGRRL